MEQLQPEYIFETSWEVCNRVGGIYTVLSTRAASMQKAHKDKVFFIGPDVWGKEPRTKSQEPGQNDKPVCPYFKEIKSLLAPWQKQAAKEGLRVRVGRWDIPGKPIAILVDFTPFWLQKDAIYAHNWEQFGVDSLHAYGDYDESSIFGYATGVVMESLYRFYQLENSRVVAHFNEWMTSFGLFYVKEHLPKVGTLFTTHATSIGRSIAGNNKPLYDYFEGYNGDQMAAELNMQAKHSCEKQAAHYADCFTTVSEITNRECAQLLDKPADVVTPNGFEGEFVPKTATAFATKRKAAREALRHVAEEVLGYSLSKNPLFICTSGRYEWKNKGIDVFLHALRRLAELQNAEPAQAPAERRTLNTDIVAFVMVPAWQCGAHGALGKVDHYTTHQLCQPENDPTLQTLQWLEMRNTKQEGVKVIFVPSYLNGDDGVFDMPYYDLLIGMDLTVFPSYYEPWGYTPLESSAFHVPTLTTCLSGYGQWATFYAREIEHGIEVVNRTDSGWGEVVEAIANTMYRFAHLDAKHVEAARKAAAGLAEKAAWKHFFRYYEEAYAFALKDK